MSTLADLRNIRLEKLNKLVSLGIDPYPATSYKNTPNSAVASDFQNLEDSEVIVAGRIVAIRGHGKLVFMDIRDSSGEVQLYLKSDDYSGGDYSKNELKFPDLDLLDAGDFVEACGKVSKTQRGEISIFVDSLRLLTKTLRPLPLSWDGLQDKETRLRRRYLDLVVNPDVMALFKRKARFWEVNRSFMKSRGFIEVETPALELVTGGADAAPFVTHHNALDQDFYLRISTELYQKRLIGGGFEKIYTLGPNFRNEGIDDEHLQEYYQLEWYWAYADYRDNMEMVKDMFRYVSEEVYGTTKFERKGIKFDLASDWEEIDYVEVIADQLGVDVFKDSEEKMITVLKNHSTHVPAEPNRARLVDSLWKVIRKDIPGPAFLINEPKFMSPLAKSKSENPEITERFHVILAGSELGNGYSELNDPMDQLARFKEQQGARDAGDDEAQMLDVDYVEMLEYGMPPTSGYAHSERLFWFLEDIPAREGTLFPQMKFELDSTTKNLYNLT
jgi:lysyl-tRNA synthetase, class II